MGNSSPPLFGIAFSTQTAAAVKACLVTAALLGLACSSSWPASPYKLLRETRAADAQRTRFFTGNNAVDSGAAGAALGVGAQYFLNQFLNPCTRVSVNPTSSNRKTNKRILGSNPTVTNGALGFLAGFATASLAHQAAGSPCGR